MNESVRSLAQNIATIPNDPHKVVLKQNKPQRKLHVQIVYEVIH